jgi:hypothetical protein
VLGRRLGKREAKAAALVVTAVAVLAACVYAEAQVLLPVGPVLAVEAFRGRGAHARNRVSLGAAVAAGVAISLALVVIVPPSEPQEAAASEPEAAARVLTEILHGQTDLSYTVVGPPTWTGRVVGAAYRADLAEFARRLQGLEAIDPGFTIPVPSKRVLVLTEKRPFASEVGGHPYNDPTARAELMKVVRNWLARYAQFHSGAEIVYEDSDIQVWQIDQGRDAALSERFGMAQQ